MSELRVLSLFSGVGGFDMAARTVGMDTVMACEIDPQARAVFRHNFPETHIAHDIKRLRRKELNEHGPFDILCGGFPCQDISVAGKRMGLAGTRSGLFHRIMRLIPKLETRPRWIILENVNGLLSSGERRDMGTVLTELEKRGYWWAYRRLDLQFFGCPQRRKRIFIVGHLGDAAPAGQVLFEPEGMPWDSAKGQGQGKGVAALTANGVGTCGADDNQAQAGHLIPSHTIAPCLQERGGKGPDSDCTQAMCISGKISPTVTGGPPFSRTGNDRVESEAMVTCFNARQDPNVSGGVSEPLGAKDTGHGVMNNMQVRRLTPLECERLMGWPDNWTRYGIDDNGHRVEMSDSARYRMCGNGVGEPCVRFILEGIKTVGREATDTLSRKD